MKVKYVPPVSSARGKVPKTLRLYLSAANRVHSSVSLFLHVASRCSQNYKEILQRTWSGITFIC